MARLRGDKLPPPGAIYELGDETPILDLLKGSRPQHSPFREGKYTHVSDIISKCARMIALIRRLDLKHAPQIHYDGHVITFEQGSAIGEFIKRRFRDSHPDKIWGRWECRCGKTVTHPMIYSSITRAHTCNVCGELPKKYVEMVFEDDQYEVVGSCDVLLYFDKFPAYYVVEVKSMAKETFDCLERPQPDHIIQAMFYWNLMRRKGYPLMDRFSILYVKKEYTWKLPYKEFVIDPAAQARHLEPFLRDLSQIAAARDPKAPLPPRIQCGTPNAPEAKKCPVCTTCFQLPAK